MSRRLPRRSYLASAGLALGALAGCTGGGSTGGGSTPSATTTAPTETDETPADPFEPDSETLEGGPPTLDEPLPLPLSAQAVSEQAVSGGPPKDGIPAIEQPQFEPVADVGDRLADEAPVFGVVGETEAKAYPQNILVYHEIANDTLDGRPVSVTYCPLTGTAMGFERGGTSFGVSGRLVNNNLIMYDRATESWWPQVLATAIPGRWNLNPPVVSLQGFRVIWTTWGRWRAAYPDSSVLTRETGHARNYNRDPYGDYTPLQGYYAPDAPPMFAWLGGPDDRFPPKEVFIGARAPDGAVAFHKDTLRESKLMTGSLGDTEVLAVYDPTLDTDYLYRNPEGAAFEHAGDSVVAPDGTAHEPAALPLERLLALDAMWFAWSGFYPGSSVHG